MSSSSKTSEPPAPLSRKNSEVDDGSIKARIAIANPNIIHAPPLIKAKLLVEMASKAEYRKPMYREFAKKLILNTFGQECHEMKRQITFLKSSQGFVNVVYDFIQNEHDRKEVLYHLVAQVPDIKFATKRDSVIVLSDVDDTLFQSSALMGGPKYPSKCKFPGVEKLYMEVAWKVVFITARPAVLKSMTLHEFRRKLAIPYIGILCGKTSDLLWAAFDRQKAWAKMAQQKYHNFDMISSVYPECKFLWFGDSGQGDLETGRMMVQRKPEQMLAVYIHDVVESTGITPTTGGMARTVSETQGILHFDTYLDTALHLNKIGFLSLQSMFRVAACASEEWKELSISGKWASEEVRTARAKEFTADLEAVNMVLLKNGMATVSVCGTSLPEKLTPRISPRRKKELVEEAHINSLSGIEQLKLRAQSVDESAREALESESAETSPSAVKAKGPTSPVAVRRNLSQKQIQETKTQQVVASLPSTLSLEIRDDSQSPKSPGRMIGRIASCVVPSLVCSLVCFGIVS